MFKRKRNKENVPDFAVVLQTEIDEIMDIIEEQQRQIEQLNENLKLLHQLCNKGTER